MENSAINNDTIKFNYGEKVYLLVEINSWNVTVMVVRRSDGRILEEHDFSNLTPGEVLVRFNELSKHDGAVDPNVDNPR